MSLLRLAKHTLLRALDSAGLNRRIIDSAWRARRLLIICWHGVSSDDEHVWNPSMFMSPGTFHSRLELLRAMDCELLPLGEGLAKLKSGSLPPRAVCLTIDDGDSSFYLRAWPMLREFGFPATLYWTTYYSSRPHAVFDPMLSYILWKGRGKSLALTDPPLRCSLETQNERGRAFNVIYEHSRNYIWTADQKESFLLALARQLDVDYAGIKSKRVLHLISPAEARSMVSEGLDLQLHTHRHRVSQNRQEFAVELADNARVLREAGADAPAHFCYPSGSYLRSFAPWLRDLGIVSASTCESGLVSRDTDPYFLPRFMDHQGISPVEFQGWLSGIASAVRGKHEMDSHGFR
jgi:peptidoglycan/xylan/chitin deacetylase (PgdA/CDA1 family)